MNSSTSSASSASTASQEIASDFLGSSGTTYTGRSMMGNFVDFLFKNQTFLMILVYLIYEFSSQRDGQWSDWGSWSVCKNGLSKRSRHCTNPPLSIFWRNCHGDSIEYKTCNLVSCKDEKKSFPGSDIWYSGTSKHVTEMKSNFLRLLSEVPQRTDQLEKSFEKLELSIERVNNQQKERGDRIEQASKMLTDRFISFKSDINKTVEDRIASISTDHDVFKQELTTTVKELKDQAVEIAEINAKKEAFVALNMAIDKITSLSTDHDQFKEQINAALKEGEEQIKLISTTVTTIQRAYDSLKEQTVSMSKYQNELKQETGKIEERFEEQTQAAIKKIEIINQALNESKMYSNKAKEQTTAAVGEIEKQMKVINTEMFDGKKDGAWSSWSNLGSCSVTCGGGIQSQTRTCTNPKPSLLGKYCDGAPIQVSFCNKQTCPDLKVAFTAYGSGTESSYTTIKFPKTHFNSGGAYDTSTGRFTCKIPGIYHFAVTLTKRRTYIDLISATVRINDNPKLELYSNPYNDCDGPFDIRSYSLSAAGTFHLDVNDYVDVYCVPSDFYNGYGTFFTGFLVIPDTEQWKQSNQDMPGPDKMFSVQWFLDYLNN